MWSSPPSSWPYSLDGWWFQNQLLTWLRQMESLRLAM